MLLLLDNYDSFVHNLARYFRRLGQETRVLRSDAIDVAGIRQLQPAAIILSPGPCTPSEAGCCLEVVRQLSGQVPMLGVCLGHQTIAQALGGTIVRAPQPVHGRSSPITHSGSGIFAGLPSPLMVGRYHSLVAEAGTLPPQLSATAHTADGTIMALAHATHPTWGVQFHPESILTSGGYQLLANFLRGVGLSVVEPLPTMQQEQDLATQTEYQPPAGLVTF